MVRVSVTVRSHMSVPSPPRSFWRDDDTYIPRVHPDVEVDFASGVLDRLVDP